MTDIIFLEAFLLLACAIAKTRKGKVTILYIIQADSDRPLNEYARDAQVIREEFEKYLHEKNLSVEIKITVRVSYQIANIIYEEANSKQVDVILFHWDMLTEPEIYEKLGTLPNDFVVLRPGEDFDLKRPWQKIDNILLPISGGAQTALNLRVAMPLSELTGAQVTPLHIVQPEEKYWNYQRMFNYFVHNSHHMNTPIALEGEVTGRIMEQVVSHQVLIIGTPLRDDNTKDWMGRLTRVISEQFRRTLIVINRHKDPNVRNSTISIWGERPLAIIVDKWFAEHTYHSNEFGNIEKLLKLKEARKVKISLGLPSLNEEETLGNVIRTIKTPLMDEIPLLDEIVLIDSNSTDRTRDIALDLGLPVYIHQEILPEYGQFKGKGEALWKSLYVLQGDIIVWVDTDITNIHPRFIYGVIGPLLKYQNIHYVKGFYRRPIKIDNTMEFSGGGRVTELTIRPLINLFYPALSGIIQPLSGEYAGWRTALEQIPFFTGYGVEIGLLLDLYRKLGLHSIAQVNLVERIHRNQTLFSLSRMAFAIVQAVMKRLEEQNKLKLLEDIDLTMNLVRYAEQNYWLQTEEIKEYERPPMETIPEYRARFKK